MGLTQWATPRARTAGRRVQDWARATWAEHWIALCGVLLFLASDTKFVLKGRVSGAGTAVDLFIVAEVAVYAAVGAYLVLRRGAWRSRPGGPHRFEVLLGALIVAMALSTAFSAVPVYSAVRTGQALVVVLLARAAIATGSLSWFRPFATLTLWATTGLVLAGLVLPTQKGPLQADRFNWLATHPVVVGQFTALACVIGLVLTWGSWATDSPDRPPVRSVWLPRVALGLPTLICAWALASTHTRGSVIAALIGTTVALLLLVPPTHRLSLALATVWGAAALAVAGTGWALSWFARGEGAESLLTLNSRTELWSLALTRTLEQSPGIGFGVGASRSIFYAETGLGGGHNAVVNVFADLGFLGLLIWGTVVVWPAMIVWQTEPVGRWRLDRTIWLAALVVLVVNAVTYEGLGSAPTIAFTWLIMLTAAATLADEAHRCPRSPAAGQGPLAPRIPDTSRRNPIVTAMTQPTTGHPTLAQSIRRHSRLVGGLGIGLMVLMSLVAFLSTPAAVAEGRLGLTFPPAGNVLLPVPTGEASLKRYVAQRAQFAKSDAVLAQVADATGLSTEQLRARLRVEPAEPGNGLRFLARGGSAESASGVVTAAMQAYREQTGQEATRRAEEVAAGQRGSGFPGLAARTLADLQVFGDGVEFVVSPGADTTRTRGVPWREALIGLLAGIAIGAVIAWFIEDARYRRQSEA